MKKIKDFYLVQAWLILIVAIFFGAALASIQIVLGQKIEQNKVNEIKQRVPELVLSTTELEKLNAQGASLDVEFTTITVKKNNKAKSYNTYKAKNADGSTIGYVVKAGGQGYADKIELLFGLDKNAEKINAIYILDQKETPGLGNKIVTDKWQNQFKNKPTEALEVVKTGAKNTNEIDAITGATISSRSVCNIINSAIKDLKEPLKNR